METIQQIKDYTAKDISVEAEVYMGMVGEANNLSKA